MTNTEETSPKRIREVIYRENRALFPISWLHTQEYCEYQLFLEKVRGLKAPPTRAMAEGKQEHEKLFTEFAKRAVPSTVPEMLAHSKTAPVSSREFRVEDIEHGIYGLIDEVLLTPEEFVVIDDKPGTSVYLSNIHQVYGYCLAFKYTVADARAITAALRQRGSDRVYWHTPFAHDAEEEIVQTVGHIHDLVAGRQGFGWTTQPARCRACRLRENCDHASP